MNKRKFLPLCLSASLVFVFFNANISSMAQQNYSLSGQVSRTSTYVEGLIKDGKYSEAQAFCEKELQRNPNNHAVRVSLGNVFSKQYKLDAAMKEYQTVLSKNPDNCAAHEGLGDVLYKKTTSSNMEIIKNTDKLYNQALEEYKSAIKLNPNDYRAYNGAGKIMQEMGKLNSAQDYYNKALDIEPKYPDALENLGTILYSKNQVNAAIEKYEEAIEQGSKNSSAYYHLGESLIAKGDYSKAINDLQTSLYLFPNSAPVHNMLGQAYEKQGNEAAAITEYSKASLIKPEYSPPYLKLANIYQNRGDSEFAINQLKSAISLNPDFAEGKLKVADISLDTGKIDQAITYYNDLLNNKNYKNVALKGLANAYFTQAQQINNKAGLASEDEYLNVEKSIKQAIQYNPDDLQLYLALLRVSRLTNKEGQADLYLSKIIDNPTGRPIDHVVKGEAFITYGKYNDAQNEFRTALTQVHNTSSVIQLGEMFVLNRQYQPAKEAFSRVLANDPQNVTAKRYLDKIKKSEDDAESQYNIAKAFYDEHQRLAAIEALRDCISINPDLPEAQLLLAKAFEKEKYYTNAIEHYNIYINLASTDDIQGYQRKINSLTNKVQKMQEQGKIIKKYTRI